MISASLQKPNTRLELGKITKWEKLHNSKTALAGAVSGIALLVASQASAQELTVAYFLEWPTPNQYAQHNDMYEEALGMTVNWVSFDAGTAMSAAMASGDVQIAFSQGLTPFLVATAAGQDLSLVDIAVTYSDNDNCVARTELEITADNPSELAGLEVGVPLGTAAHSGFLAQMKHFGIEVSSMKVVDMAPVDSAAAFASGNLDMVCGWGGALARTKEHGNVLLSGSEKEAVVGRVFDVTSTPTAWAQENSETLAKFLAVTAEMNAIYAVDREPMLADIQAETGMDMAGTISNLDVFSFPTVDDQLSERWFGGFLAGHLAEKAAALAEAGQITPLSDYSTVLDSSYLEAASAM